jgi:glycerol dehydrogenase-like iron-containing ADH family enzyme
MIGSEFPTVFGRNLVSALASVAHTPYLVVTMEDLWPQFDDLLGSHVATVHCVTSLDLDEVTADAARLPAYRSVVGLGGGQAMDVAKFFSWVRNVPLFQVPTAMTTNAPFAHRALLRTEGKSVAIGWAVPEVVYVDFDVIKRAPALLNRSGVCDVLCAHTAHFDWKLAHDTGKEERQWPYDVGLVAESRVWFDSVLAGLDEIRAVTDEGIRTLMLAHRWGGAAFHNAGWNDRHLNGVDHCFLYCLEYVTGVHFIHGQGVGLGIYLGAELQDNEPEMMLETLQRTGVDIRPEAMGISWEDASTALRRLAWYVRYADLPYTVADARDVTESLIERARERLYGSFGEWSDDQLGAR